MSKTKQIRIITQTSTTMKIVLKIPRTALLAALRKAGLALPDHDHIECHVAEYHGGADLDIDDSDTPLLISFEKTEQAETEEPVTS